MDVIYQPAGRAGEYSELAVNLYRGCKHGCKYCYAPRVLRMTREEFFGNPQPRKDVLKNLEKDARKYTGDPRPVMLCFTCDPYQMGVDWTVTSAAIDILKRNDLSFKTLSKSVLVLSDVEKYGPKDWLGMTLTCDNYSDSIKWEPNATPPLGRLEALRQAKEMFGINTWASCEPVLYPAQTLNMIERAHEFVDHFKVGKLNHREFEKQLGLTDEVWRRFAHDAVNLLERLDADYYIKDDLLKYLPEGTLQCSGK